MVLDMENPPGFFLLKYIIDQHARLSIYLAGEGDDAI